MNLPGDFKNRMKDMLGEEYPAFLENYNNKHFSALRLNPSKDTNFLAEYLDEPVKWAQNAYYFNPDTSPMGKLPYHNMGLYYIQEPSAMFPAEVLSPSEGEVILDLCASPGGKSTQIALKMNNTGLLISNEIIPKRANVLKDNIARLGIRNAIVLNESPDAISKRFDGFFDKILVDAPCSGEGMFRKNPEAIGEWSVDNVKNCATRQLDILNTIKNCLKNDGILVYSTCTFSPEENEQVIEKFLIENPDFELAEIENKYFQSGLKKNAKTGLDDITKTVRIFPHKTNGEGHFVAKLIKHSENNEFSAKTQKSTLNKKALSLWQDFEKKHLTTSFKGVFLQFGDNIYVAPQNCPVLDKIKVLYSGLLLGKIENNRFTPSHELALSLNPNDVKNQAVLNDVELVQYIHGETIPTDLNTDGWVLITYKNNAVGWGKISNNTIKNHYPKYLRI